MPFNFCMSYSCGKDSTLALHRLIEQGNRPVALVVTVNKDAGRSWFHGIDGETLRLVSGSLGIPLIEAVCEGGDDYEKAFETALTTARDMGATHCAFGDIDIEAHKSWCEARCSSVGLEPAFPLWQQNRLDICNDFIDLGYTGVIKAVSKAHKLPQSLLGKKLDRALIAEIESHGADACGENGEYHTFVCDGPIFSKPVSYQNRGVMESEYAFSMII